MKYIFLLLYILSFGVFAQCGDLQNNYGPFDYRSATNEQRKLVEDWHFNSDIQRFKSRPNNTLGGDVDYTLRAFPNNHRALLHMMNIAVREKTDKPYGARYTIECYFDRAIRFRDDDGQVRLLYGIYLLRKGEKDRAIQQLQLSENLSGDDANIFYNLGMAYYNLGDFDKSLVYAHKAYSYGFPLNGLRNMLIRRGKWKDMPPEVTLPAAVEGLPSETVIAEPVGAKAP